MTRRIAPILVLTASLILSACAAPSPSTGTVPDQTQPASSAKTESSSVETVTLAEYEALEKDKNAQIAALKDEIDLLEKGTDQAPDNSAIAFRQRPAGMLYFPVFTLNGELEPEAAGYVAIRPQAEVSDKLDTLTRGISQILFAGRPMEVTAVRTEDEQTIVYVDLKDRAQWQQVFQGTTGGGINSQALIASYLQADYRNAWIDGVHFTLDGEPVLFEHAPLLEETQYRD